MDQRPRGGRGRPDRHRHRRARPADQRQASAWRGPPDEGGRDGDPAGWPPPGPAEPDLSVPTTEGTEALDLVSGSVTKGGFMVNWTFAWQQLTRTATSPTTSATPATRQTVAGEQVEAPDRRHQRRREPLRPATSTWRWTPPSASPPRRSRCATRSSTANMPARQGGLRRRRAAQAASPADLLELWQQSIDTGGPPPPSPYWATIVNATLQREWHPGGLGQPGLDAGVLRRTSSSDALQGKAVLLLTRGGGHRPDMPRRDRRGPARPVLSDRARAERALRAGSWRRPA